jgi:alkylated DNA repair dioxygenase AlkB
MKRTLTTLASWVNNKRKKEEEIHDFKRINLKQGNGKCWLLIMDKLPPSIYMSRSIFEEIWNLHPIEFGKVKLFGKEINTPRWQESFGQSYNFSGMEHKARPINTHSFLDDIVKFVCCHSGGLPYGQLLINWYESGTRHKIGWHADDEGQLADPTWDDAVGIYSFSFGQTRRFDLRAKNSKVSECEIDVKDNTCLVMMGETQSFYKHQVPLEKKRLGKRINITVRIFKQSYLRYKTCEILLQYLVSPVSEVIANYLY